MNYDYLKSFYNAIGDGVYAFDMDGKIIHFNAMAEKLLGFKEEDVLGKIGHFIFHSHHEKVGLLQCELYKAFLRGESYNSEDIFITKNNTFIDVNIQGNPIIFSDKIVGYVVLFRDISETKNLEKEREAFYSIVQNTDDIIVIKNLDLKVIATNQAYVKVSGHRCVEELIGKTDAEIFGIDEETEPVSGYMLDERRAQKLPHGKSIIREEPVIFPDGSIHIYKTRKFPIYKHGVLFATANISVDITSEKEYAQNLEFKISEEMKKSRENESFYNKIFETANLGICLTDIEGRFVVVNPAYCSIYGYNESELIGEHFTMVVPQENRENMKQLHDDFLAFKKEEIGQEFQVLRKNGKLIHIYASAGILEDIVGGPYKITTISDISELVQAREVQKEQERMLVQQSKLAAVGEMIGNIAHQWRQPLNVINCTTLDIKLKKDMHQMNDDFIERSLQNIEKLTEQMSETINDFMNFYKPDKKKSLFNLYDSIMNVYKIIATQLLQEQISFSLNIDKDIQIYGTKNELQQIILNIFSNSKDAFANQKINNKQLSIYYTKKDNRSHLCIEDNAGGIEPELLEKIFLPYFTTKEEMNGTGIGLYMSAMIASNSFSGTLSAQNITNNNKRIGVRFILDFPIKKDL